MSETKERTARERVEGGERLLSLSEIATIMGQKRANVAKFLARRGVEPAMPKASGYFWWESDILRVKAEREADGVRMAADEKRKAAAIRRRDANGVTPVAAIKLGPSQTAVLLELLRRPIKSPQGAQRHALRRLRERGYVESMTDVSNDTVYVLTEEGRRVAAEIGA